MEQEDRQWSRQTGSGAVRQLGREGCKNGTAAEPSNVSVLPRLNTGDRQPGCDDPSTPLGVFSLLLVLFQVSTSG